MKKRIIAVFLAFLLVVSFVPFSAFAEEKGTDEPRSSSYLDMYSAALYSRGVSGKLQLEFEVFATGNMTKVGVYGIFVRNNDGSIHSVIWGSTSNGLLDTNTWFHAGSYTLNLTSGNTYYCSVIVIAKDGNGSDTRTITTQHMTCP